MSTRIAGAPISWGVCEVPNWGYQLEADRVLDEMVQLGLSATEFGPPGFLPESPAERSALLSAKGLAAVGGFLPLVLHDPELDPAAAADAFVTECLAVGANVMVLAASTGLDGYDVRPVLTEDQWSTLYRNLDRIAEQSAARGILAALHPHMGTVVENADEVSRVMTHSQVQFCIDTGHLVAAGADPVAITAAHPDRVGHVHLKDVDGTLAQQVQNGSKTFSEGVAAGLFCPLGDGIVDVSAMIDLLERAGYTGWYVLEQDLKLENGAPTGDGPITDVRRCQEFVLEALSSVSAGGAR